MFVDRIVITKIKTEITYKFYKNFMTVEPEPDDQVLKLDSLLVFGFDLYYILQFTIPKYNFYVHVLIIL